MTVSEVERAAGGFCYLDAAATGISGLIALATGPRLVGLAKVAGAGSLAWSAVAPGRRRLQVAAGVSAGLAAVDLISAFRPRLRAGQRVFRLTGAAFNAVFAMVHHEASRDI